MHDGVIGGAMSQVFSSKFLAVFAVSWLFFGCVESGSDSDGSTPSIAVTPGQGGGAGTPEKPGDSSDNSGSSEDNAGTSGDTHSGGAGTGDNAGSWKITRGHRAIPIAAALERAITRDLRKITRGHRAIPIAAVLERAITRELRKITQGHRAIPIAAALERAIPMGEV